MALKITQRTASRQPGTEPTKVNASKAVSRPVQPLKSSVTPQIAEPVNPKVIGDLNPLTGRSIAPLIGPLPLVEVNGFRLTEKIHGWGGYNIVFLDLHPVLDAMFAGQKKWSASVVKSTKWTLSSTQRWNISIEGINQ